MIPHRPAPRRSFRLPAPLRVPLPLRVRLLAALVAAASLGGGALGPLPSAGAVPIGTAQAQAQALRTEVNRLTAQAEVAIEHYDAVEARLGVVVTEFLSGEDALGAAQTSSGDVSALMGERIRALYMSGGEGALLASALQGGSIEQVLANLTDVRAVLTDDQVNLAAANHRVDTLAKLTARLSRLAAERTALERAAAARADAVQTVLGTEQSLLAAADAQVRALAAAAGALAAAADGQAFAALLADARRAAGLSPDLSTTDTPPNAVAAAAVAAIRTRIGSPYVWGATGPDTFDCSGLTQWAYAAAGVQLPRVAADQYHAGTPVPLADLAPGDLLFWATDPADPSTIHHVGMYIGDGNMIAAAHTGTVVSIQPVFAEGFVGAVRPTG